MHLHLAVRLTAHGHSAPMHKCLEAAVACSYIWHLSVVWTPLQLMVYWYWWGWCAQHRSVLHSLSVRLGTTSQVKDNQHYTVAFISD